MDSSEDRIPAAPAGDDSAKNWLSALEAEDGTMPAASELVWYGDHSPNYGEGPTPAQIEAARRFVSHWLEGDNHGFIIPGSEWGQSLKHWLHMLVGHPAPGAELIVDPPRSYISIEDDERTLLEQVRERRFGPNSWVNILVYDRTMVGDRSEEEIAEALAEARRMRREDEDETRSMLGREF